MTADTKTSALTSKQGWLHPLILVALVGWLALRESGALEVGDVFWHLRTGDLIRDEGLPGTDPFSWTAGGETWQPNAWLGDVIWSVLRSAFGSTAISFLGGLAVVGVALLLYRRCRRIGSGPWAAITASAIAVVLMSPFIAPRPLLIGFVLFPIAIEAAKRFRDGSAWALAGVAVLLALWSNLHGSFVTGVGVVGLIAVGWAIDDREWRRPLGLAATAVVAGLLNPFTISAYLHTLDVRDESVNIDEWQPLSLSDARGVFLVGFMLITALLLWRASKSRQDDHGAAAGTRRWETVLPVLVLAIGTLAVIRTGAFFLIIAAPLVAKGLSGIKAVGLRKWAGPRVGPLTVGLLLAAIILAAQQLPVLDEAGKPGTRFSSEITDAIPATCTILNEYDLGGFIIDQRWPEVLVSQDGRNDLYGAAEVERQEAILSSTDVAALDADGVSCVLADKDRPLASALAASGGWETIAESTELILLVKR